MSSVEDIRRAWWLASYPKSGSTWLRLMLAAHRFGVERWDINNASDLTRLDVQSLAHQTVSPVALAELTPAQTLYLRHAALLHIIAGTPGNPPLLKTHNANIRVIGVDLIPFDLTAGAVYIVRDPRDVCVSYAHHIGRTLEHTAHAMAQDGHQLRTRHGLVHWVTSWSAHVRGWLDHGQIERRVVVRYEDMHAQPAVELRRVLEAIGWACTDGSIERAVRACAFDDVQRQEQQRGFGEATEHGAFFRRGVAGGWRDELPPALVRRIELEHGEMMQRLGYQLGGADANAA